MEMHQIRYFLAVSRTLNFTRAAEECNVSQPALTRAVKLLEEELGGELLRRERTLSHLTELGQQLLPLLQQCYDSANAAKAMARTLAGGEQASVAVTVSRSINLEPFTASFRELSRACPRAQIRLDRAPGPQIAESLKKGEADLAVASSLGEDWERFDRWPLFTERLDLVVSHEHPLARHPEVAIEQLAGERFLVHDDIDVPGEFAQFWSADGAAPFVHRVAAEHDTIPLLRANLGIAIMPASAARSEGLRHLHVKGCEFERSVALYGVAGRRRSPVATTLVNLLRATDWSRLLH